MTHEPTTAELIDAVNGGLDDLDAALDEIGAPTADGTPAERIRAWVWAIHEALDNAGTPCSRDGIFDDEGIGVPGGDLDLIGRIEAWAEDREDAQRRARRAGSAAVRKTLLDRMTASRDLRLGAAACIAPESAALRRYATMEESAVHLVSDLLPVSAEEEGVEG